MKRLKKKQLVKKIKKRKIKMKMNNFILKKKVIKNTKMRIKEVNQIFSYLMNYQIINKLKIIRIFKKNSIRILKGIEKENR